MGCAVRLALEAIVGVAAFQQRVTVHGRVEVITHGLDKSRSLQVIVPIDRIPHHLERHHHVVTKA
eukprot:11695922-Prorocentrum_lima.AAC.1